MSRIAVLGAGAWGTALSINLQDRGGNTVTLWSHSQSTCDALLKKRENSAYLPGIRLPDELAVTCDAATALQSAEIVVCAVPSKHLRTICEQIAALLRPGQIIVSATKGLEPGSLLRMTEVISGVLSDRGLSLPCAALSGPSFAQEVAAGSPTALTVAHADSTVTGFVQREFSGPVFRLYTNDDVIGVELGGALKNVIAIASGVVVGLGLGHNSAAALITRGIAEITRLAVASGAKRETLAGLAGVGDVVLTCTGSLSRNRRVGIELGKGEQLADILRDLHGKVAEGVGTTFAALDLARKCGIEMPIAEQMAAILRNAKSPVDAMWELMARPGRDE